MHFKCSLLIAASSNFRYTGGINCRQELSCYGQWDSLVQYLFVSSKDKCWNFKIYLFAICDLSLSLEINFCLELLFFLRLLMYFSLLFNVYINDNVCIVNSSFETFILVFTMWQQWDCILSLLFCLSVLHCHLLSQLCILTLVLHSCMLQAFRAWLAVKFLSQKWE